MAEYRAYQYIVKQKTLNKPLNEQALPAIITTSLSPTSYLAYNGGPTTIEIELLNTWMCPGNTSHRKICSPIQQENNGN